MFLIYALHFRKVLTVFSKILQDISDGNLTITTKFINGDVIFTWTGASSEYYYVYVKKDGTREPANGWYASEKTNYTVKNALLYHSIEIGAAVPGNRISEETYRGNMYSCNCPNL